MYGAIIGDIIGSQFEFDRGGKTREFELFSKHCSITDDTVMTIAVADALMKENEKARAAGMEPTAEQLESHVRHSMHKWARVYPDAGYGGRFYGWLHTRGAQAYGSFGNGSAMRVSAAGWLYGTIEQTRLAARATAMPTHNHPEGIKGAEATASAIFMARNGASKDEIKAYVEENFAYDPDRTLDEIRPYYHHVESCQETVPEAIRCFLEADSFEETIRNVMYIGGDTDTLGAIAGAIADAAWGIPDGIFLKAMQYIPGDIREVLERFEQAVR